MNNIPITPQGIPLIGFGTWPLAAEQAERTVAMALEVGFRHIDTAQIYGNEREVGRAIKASGLKREEVFVTTKMARDNLPRDRFADAVEKSLAALDMETVDLLLIHWPPAEAEFNGAIERLVAAKARRQARRIGVSNFTIAMMARAQRMAEGAIVCNQVEFHPLLDQSRVKAEAARLGMGLAAYSPLARGAVLREPELGQIAQRLGRPISQVALRWIVQQGVAAIPMTTKRESAISNLDVTQFSLSDADMAAIGALTKRHRRLISPSGWAPIWDR